MSKGEKQPFLTGQYACDDPIDSNDKRFLPFHANAYFENARSKFS